MEKLPNTVYEIRHRQQETDELTKKNDTILRKDVLPYVNAVRFWAIVAAVGAFLGGLSAAIELSIHIYDRRHADNRSCRMELKEQEFQPITDSILTINTNASTSKTNGVNDAEKQSQQNNIP